MDWQPATSVQPRYSWNRRWPIFKEETPSFWKPFCADFLEREPYSGGDRHLLGLIAYQARLLEETESLFARVIVAG
jgi:hypothetical protein